MNTETIEIFIHLAGQKPVVVNARETEVLSEVLKRAGIAPDPDMHLFASLGDQEDQDSDTDDDEVEPVQAALTLYAAGIKHHGRVHCHHCRRIVVTVNFQGQSKDRKFAPSARIARVRRWALKAYKLTGPAAADFVLQLCGTDKSPRPNQDLADVVAAGTCTVCFDLTKEITPQG